MQQNSLRRDKKTRPWCSKSRKRTIEDSVSILVGPLLGSVFFRDFSLPGLIVWQDLIVWGYLLVFKGVLAFGEAGACHFTGFKV